MLELIAEINESLSGSDDVRANVRTALEALTKGLRAEFAFLARLDEDGSMRLAETFGLNLAGFRRLESDLAARPFELSFEHREAILVDLETFDQIEHANLEGHRAILTVPAVAGKICAGIIGVCVEPDCDLDEAGQLALLAGSMIAQTLRIERAVRGERERLREENTHLKQELKEKYDFSHIVGNSNAMKLVYEQITQVAKSNATVLLRGESGTGKEMIANAIHYNSLRSKKPFIKINCAAIPETLIESEIFGQEKGAFTGADRSMKGSF